MINTSYPNHLQDQTHKASAAASLLDSDSEEESEATSKYSEAPPKDSEAPPKDSEAPTKDSAAPPSDSSSSATAAAPPPSPPVRNELRQLRKSRISEIVTKFMRLYSDCIEPKYRKKKTFHSQGDGVVMQICFFFLNVCF